MPAAGLVTSGRSREPARSLISSQISKKKPEQKLRLSKQLGEGLYLPVQLAAQDARQAEDARTEQQDAAGLRSRGLGLAGEREGFPAPSTIAIIDTALPEVASRRTAGDPAVRDVPRLRSIVGGVGGIADGEPVRVAGCHGCGGNTNLNVVNAITVSVGKEEGAVTSI